MIAIAATSTRSEREIASLVCLGIVCVTRFGLLVIAWSIRLGLFRACGSFRPFGVQCAVAISIRLFRSCAFPQKVPNGSQTLVWADFALPKTNRQTKNFINMTDRHIGLKNP